MGTHLFRETVDLDNRGEYSERYEKKLNGLTARGAVAMKGGKLTT